MARVTNEKTVMDFETFEREKKAERKKVLTSESVYNPIVGDYKVWDFVQVIDEGAFAGQTQMTSVELPESVTEIRDGAFRGCVNLQSVKMTPRVKSISNNAFNGCSSLQRVENLSDKSYVCHTAFESCGKLDDGAMRYATKIARSFPVRSEYFSFDDWLDNGGSLRNALRIVWIVASAVSKGISAVLFFPKLKCHYAINFILGALLVVLPLVKLDYDYFLYSSSLLYFLSIFIGAIFIVYGFLSLPYNNKRTRYDQACKDISQAGFTMSTVEELYLKSLSYYHHPVYTDVLSTILFCFFSVIAAPIILIIGVLALIGSGSSSSSGSYSSSSSSSYSGGASPSSSSSSGSRGWSASPGLSTYWVHYSCIKDGLNWTGTEGLDFTHDPSIAEVKKRIMEVNLFVVESSIEIHSIEHILTGRKIL